DAADLSQEAFLAVARHVGRFRHEQPGDAFRGWLFTIVRNKIRDRARRAQLAGVGGDDPRLERLQAPQGGAREEAPEAEGRRLVWRGVLARGEGEFEPRSWQAFWRVVVQGDRPDDIAAELDMTVNAVYLSKSRILRRLRQELPGQAGRNAEAFGAER